MLQGYDEPRLKSSFRKFYCRYNDLVCDYKLSLAHMLSDFMLYPSTDLAQFHGTAFGIFGFFTPFFRTSNFFRPKYH
jgi:hypothetical protein